MRHKTRKQKLKRKRRCRRGGINRPIIRRNIGNGSPRRKIKV